MSVPLGEILLVQFQPRGGKAGATNLEEQQPILLPAFPPSPASDG